MKRLKRVKIREGPNERLIRILLFVMGLSLTLAILLPVGDLFLKAFMTNDGDLVGPANFITYFSNPHLNSAIVHSFFVSIVTTLISVLMALVFAYALTRTNIRGRVFFKYVGLMPLFAPTMMHAIALIYLFGNKGLFTTGFFGVLPWLQFDINLYGATGIIISEIIYTFPQAFMILVVSLSMADYRLYEAAETLGSNRLRIFFTVTLPGIKYGLISALFVCFTLSFTDFGAPKVVGGDFNVLAVDIYKQVIGQQNMSMGATVGILLLVPALVAFAVDRILQKRQSAMITSRAMPFRVKKRGGRDIFLFSYCSIVTLLIAILLGAVLLASSVNVWPYDLSFTMRHFTFQNVAGNGFETYLNSIVVSVFSAFMGTAIVFLTAYLVEKTRILPRLRGFIYLLAIIPMALPGLVIGLSYIFFFNRPGFPLPFTDVVLPNPLNAVYGTVAILVIANIVHFFAVSFITATASLKKMDNEFELVSESMGVPFYKTLWRVSIPVSLPAIMEIVMYFFVNSMVTISAVIFLYPGDFKLAAIAIVNMEEAGDTAAAAAMSALILVTNIVVKILYETILKRMHQKNQRWLEDS